MLLSGPGCSSVGGGAFTELGPFYPRGDGRGLRMNKKSWNKGWTFSCNLHPAHVFRMHKKCSFSSNCVTLPQILQYPIFCLLNHRLELDGPTPTLHQITILAMHGPVSSNDVSSDEKDQLNLNMLAWLYVCLLNYAANDMYKFLLGWYKKFPEYRSRGLLLSGESYAGQRVFLSLISHLNV